jgi:hypothetical protein
MIINHLEQVLLRDAAGFAPASLSNPSLLRSLLSRDMGEAEQKLLYFGLDAVNTAW